MTPGLANLWCYGRGCSRASKPVLVWMRWIQCQQTCGGVSTVAPRSANLCWCGRGGSRASKPVLVWILWLQGQQTCAGVRSVASGPANLCWCGCGGSRASKPVLMWVRWLQGQQTCDGAYKRSLQFETIWKVDAKLMLQVAYQTIRQLACLLIDVNLPSPTYHPT